MAVAYISRTDMECRLRFHAKPYAKVQDKRLTGVTTSKMAAAYPAMISRTFRWSKIFSLWYITDAYEHMWK